MTDKKLLVITAGIFVVIFLLDIFAFGEGAITDAGLRGLPSYFNPLWATLWFTESLGLMLIAFIVLATRTGKKYLPLITLGLASLLVFVFFISENSNRFVSDRYNNPVGRIYQPLHSTIPHGFAGSFGLGMHDWSLESALPVLLCLQLPLLIGATVGLVIKYVAFNCISDPMPEKDKR